MQRPFGIIMADPNIKVKQEATVIEILSLLHPGAKKNSLRRMVDHGRVMVDGIKATRANAKVTAGAVLTVLSKSDGDETVGKYKSSIPAPEVLYSDRSIIVANKPAGLLSVATDRGEADTMFDRVFAWAWENGKTRAHLVHRLDRETSGCFILARSPEIRDMLQDQFKDRSIERIYHAVVHQKPPTKSGIETGRIQEMKDKRMRLVPEGRRAGKSAITNWWLEDTGPEHSLIRIKIDTGRRAQIRLHMANLGCPVIGDTRHGFGKASVNRLCLHASSLTFEHPNGEQMKVESPIPRQLISELKRRLG
jgi:23S rRNA pseudouridine1911/1915/1917 synthase